MKRILPVIFAILGLAIGTGAGFFLKPPPDLQVEGDEANKDAHDQQDGHEKIASVNEKPRRSMSDEEGHETGYDYVKLNNQFVVPVVKETKVSALVVMSLSIEVTLGQNEVVFAREPKLRDMFLQVLFNHANSGGFDGTFTTGEKMNDLRGSLFQAATTILGPIATDVLIIDIVRQDI